jgi:hypothetical protein
MQARVGERFSLSGEHRERPRGYSIREAVERDWREALAPLRAQPVLASLALSF